ncbi:uncharacterized protein LOC124271561 [Haliotis rubra]|uniref:uncharacterized protein LOC124271561 n=1 Tax=Haliotis rubra TaxID=36100 RepID=UPI001EE5E8AE|nr:uncharacterized protein LOC124271561 [Haliotis rubra]
MQSHHCCVTGCTASTRKQQNVHKYPWLQGVTFFSFPNRIRASTLQRRWRACMGTEQVQSDMFKTFFARSTQNASLHLAMDERKPTNELATVHVMHRLCLHTLHSAIESNTSIVIKEAEKSRMCETGTQTDLTMSDIHNMNEDLKSKSEKLDDKETLLWDLCLENVVKDDEHVRFYTGLPSCTVLLGIYYQSRPGPSRKLTIYHEYILSLVRLRLGFLSVHACLTNLLHLSHTFHI